MIAAFLILSAVILTAVWAENSSTCSSLVGTSKLPCVEIPSCQTGKHGSIAIDKLSNGLGASTSNSAISLCYTADYLSVSATSKGQKYFPPSGVYSACNDPVFNADVVELFIASAGKADPHCYSEIDSSPYDVIFESGIYNPYLNHTGISNYLMDCSASNIKHQASANKAQQSWIWTVQVPWTVVNHPTGCPSTLTTTASASAGTAFRANMFRVNELSAVSSCSSKTCEYMAWSPTLSNPPAFHEPTKFGYFLLV